MNKIVRILFTSVFSVGFTGFASADGISTRAINLRIGPGVQYPTLGVVPGGSALGVGGCIQGYRWCRVNYHGIDGWASSRYIQLSDVTDYSRAGGFGASVETIGIPLIAGLVIGSAIKQAERRHDGSYHPYYPGIGWNGPDTWGPPRPHWGDRPGWREHPGYHPNFYGPGDRWRPGPYRH